MSIRQDIQACTSPPVWYITLSATIRNLYELVRHRPTAWKRYTDPPTSHVYGCSSKWVSTFYVSVVNAQ